MLDPETCLRRATEHRRAAARATNKEIKKKFNELASLYEALAETLRQAGKRSET